MQVVCGLLLSSCCLDEQLEVLLGCYVMCILVYMYSCILVSGSCRGHPAPPLVGLCLGQRLRRRLPLPHVGLFVDLLLGNLRWQCVLLLEKLWSVLMLRMFCLIEKKSPLAGVHERS